MWPTDSLGFILMAHWRTHTGAQEECHWGFDQSFYTFHSIRPAGKAGASQVVLKEVTRAETALETECVTKSIRRFVIPTYLTAGRHVGNSFINAECAYVELMNERLSDLNFSTVVALRALCRARSGSQHLSATYASTGTSQSATQSSFAGRIVGSLKLDSKVYEEVEHDATANTQVIYIIALVSAAQAVGVFLTSLILQEAIGSILVIGVAGFITTFIGLALWSYLLYLVGTRLFKGTANPGETWRCAGFARSPGLFQAIPFIGVLVTVWMVIAQVIAAKASLDLSTGKAVAASIVSFIPYLFIQGFISLLVYGLL